MQQFASLRLMEFPDPMQFNQHAGRWLLEREGENHIILSLLERQLADFAAGRPCACRFFVVLDGNRTVAAVLASPAVAHITWAALEMMEPIVEGLRRGGYACAAVQGPGHVAFFLGRAWAESIGGHVEVGQTERLYQLARVTFDVPAGGRLAGATEADLPVVTEWLQRHAVETAQELGDAAAMARRLVQEGQLFLWHQPGPAAMGAIIPATEHAVSMRYVFVPPPLRRRGFGKAVVAALGRRVLEGGKRYAFILTDPADERADALLQSVGARTICEYATCGIIGGA